MRCLQILAFWLSWTRFHYSGSTGVLQLSQALLEVLHQWKECKMIDAAGDLESEDPEKQLVCTLVEDFGAAAPAASAGADFCEDLFVVGCEMPHLDEIMMFDFGAIELTADDDKILFAQPSTSATMTTTGGATIPQSDPEGFKYQAWSPLEIKNKGNDFFKSGKYFAAGQCYLHALDDLGDIVESGTSEPPLGATLCYNIATVLWQLSSLPAIDVKASLEFSESGRDVVHSPTLAKLKEWAVSKETALLQSIVFCEKCLALTRNEHKKALHRLCAALAELGRCSEAVNRLESYFRTVQGQHPSTSRRDDEAALQDLRRKCIARMVICSAKKTKNEAEKHANSEAVHNGDDTLVPQLDTVVGAMTSKVLSQLHSRRSRLQAVSFPGDDSTCDKAIESKDEGMIESSTLSFSHITITRYYLHFALTLSFTLAVQ